MSFFNFFRKKRKPSQTLDFSMLGVDMHSHLIPGVDDGAKNMEDSLQLIKNLRELGFKKIITTPHIYHEFYPNTSNRLLAGLDTLKRTLKEQQIEIEIACAAEYFMDEHFVELVEANDLLPVFDNYVLVEISFLSPPKKLFNYLFKLQLEGYRPIMAHPERYLYYKNDLKKYRKLKEAGCKFQLNLLSLSEHYGKDTQKNAMQLLKEGMIDFLGTDTHHMEHIQKLKDTLNSKTCQKVLSNYTFMNASFL